MIIMDNNDDDTDTGLAPDHLEHSRPVSREVEKEIDDSLGLERVQFRLEKTVVKDIKEMANKYGMSHIYLMRQMIISLKNDDLFARTARLALGSEEVKS